MRCPNCGSKMIYPATEHKNFSGGKAVAGMIAFGVIGGAAGFIGKDNKGYRCSACGAFCQEIMAYSTETAINSAVNAAKHDNDFSQYNIFREAYQNLEQIIPSGENTIIRNDSVILQPNSSEETTTQIKRTYKPNLYVCDCPIFVEAIVLKTRDNKDFLSFVACNKSTTTLRSAYFEVKVLDDAGDLITETNCVFQGLSVSSGKNLPADKEFPLNTDLAFKVDFKCVKATFVDDSVWRDEGNQTYTLSEQDAILEENFSKYKALKLKFAENKASDDVVIYQPVVTENYVQCVCGYPFNPEERCFNCGRNIEDIAELISFEILEDYEKEIIKQRAQSRYLECKKFRDNALEKNYSYALSLIKKQSVSSLDEAISILSKIEDYKDSKKQIKSCYERKSQIKEKQEKEKAERLEAERIAEEERIAQEKAKKKKQKTIMGIVASVACIAIVFIIVLNTVIIPNSKYNDAIALMNEGKYDEAVSIFVELENYKDSVQKASETRMLAAKKSFTNIQVGDYVKFGMYEQDNNSENGKEFIDWLVLDLKDNKALVISKYGLDCKAYNDYIMDVTWETCSLRKWLNSDFISSAFTSYEKEIIPTSVVLADKDPKYDTDPGKTTQDQVFLLGFTEANKYFTSDSARICIPTEYAVAKGANSVARKGYCFWWLRSPQSLTQRGAQTVHADGSFFGSFADDDDRTIRPAMWIDLSKIK